MKKTHFTIILFMALSVCPFSIAERWSTKTAITWYDQVEWPVGANFVPSTAINQLEMWQEATFDPETIDRELGWAAGIGMNTMRVFLHDLAYKQDPEGFLKRVDQYLEIADSHEIRTMFVFFDSVWHPVPKIGIQPEPIPGVHNSGWIQSPGKEILGEIARHNELKEYLQTVIARYANDQRVLVWDLFNEPDNMVRTSYGDLGQGIELSRKKKYAGALALLQAAFEWSREVNPSQPLTVGIWARFDFQKLSPIQKASIENSDVISFHTYESFDVVGDQLPELTALGRPVFCTEYMARPKENTFETILPQFKAHKIAAYNWGFINGRSQTIYPWDSWETPHTGEPSPWFHDIFRQDGTPFDSFEIELIKRLTK